MSQNGRNISHMFPGQSNPNQNYNRQYSQRPPPQYPPQPNYPGFPGQYNNGPPGYPPQNYPQSNYPPPPGYYPPQHSGYYPPPPQNFQPNPYSQYGPPQPQMNPQGGSLNQGYSIGNLPINQNIKQLLRNIISKYPVNINKRTIWKSSFYQT